MVTQLPKVLKRLEDVLLLGSLFIVIRSDGVLGSQTGTRFREVVIELLLDIGKLAVVVLDDLGRKIVKDILFQSP